MSGWNYNTNSGNFTQGGYTYDPTTGKTNGQSNAPAGYVQDESGTWYNPSNRTGPEGGYGQTYASGTFTANAPTAPTQTEQLQDMQTGVASNFAQNLPGLKANMASMLTNSSAQSLQGQNDRTNSFNAARGMGYGGVSAGEKAGNAAAARTNLNQSIMTGNQSLDQAATDMASQAFTTQYGIQQAAQAAQDQAYSRAMAAQNGNNSIVGGLIGSLGAAAIMAL